MKSIAELPNTPIDALATPGRIIRLPVVMYVTSASRASIYVWMAAGKFPKPRKIGDRRVAWLARDVQNWINGQQIAA